MKASDLKVGDVVSFEDAAYAYRGTVANISEYREVFLDGETHEVDGLQVNLTNGSSYYFLRSSDMSLYRLKMLLSNCPFCGAEETRLERTQRWITYLDCFAEGPTADNVLGAIRLWNKRYTT